MQAGMQVVMQETPGLLFGLRQMWLAFPESLPYKT